LPVLILTFFAGFERLLGLRMAMVWISSALAINIVACAIQADFQRRNPYWGEPYAGAGESSSENAIAFIRSDLPNLVSPADTVVSDYYQVIRAVADRSAGPRGAPVNQGVFVLESTHRPVDIPVGLAKQLVFSRGDVHLSRVYLVP